MNTQINSEVSNAVLTPHLNRPGCYMKSICHSTAYKSEVAKCEVSEKVKSQRKKWCENQIINLQRNPSNAVLGVTA